MWLDPYSSASCLGVSKSNTCTEAPKSLHKQTIHKSPSLLPSRYVSVVLTPRYKNVVSARYSLKMQWLNRSRKSASSFFILLHLFSLVKAVDIALSIAYSPFARSITQICTHIIPGGCCEGIGPGHLAFYWAGLRVSDIPDDATAYAFHALNPSPYMPYYGGCSGPVIGQGFGPGTWTWGGIEGVPRARLPLSGGMWVDRWNRATRPNLMKVKQSNSSSVPPPPPPLDEHSQELPLQIERRAQPDVAPTLSVLPDVIIVDGRTYTDAHKEGLYRDENGTSYTGQQLIMSDHRLGSGTGHSELDKTVV